jgi:hypothetical protein
MFELEFFGNETRRLDGKGRQQGSGNDVSHHKSERGVCYAQAFGSALKFLKCPVENMEESELTTTTTTLRYPCLHYSKRR